MLTNKIAASTERNALQRQACAEPKKCSKPKFELEVKTVYPSTLIFFVCHANEFEKILHKRYGINTNIKDSSGAFTTTIESDTTYIWLPEYKRDIIHEWYLVHEISHAIWDMCKYASIKFNNQTEEPRAYLLQYIYTEFNKGWIKWEEKQKLKKMRMKRNC